MELRRILWHVVEIIRSIGNRSWFAHVVIRRLINMSVPVSVRLVVYRMSTAPTVHLTIVRQAYPAVLTVGDGVLLSANVQQRRIIGSGRIDLSIRIVRIVFFSSFPL
jgi:hypothetical protein